MYLLSENNYMNDDQVFSDWCAIFSIIYSNIKTIRTMLLFLILIEKDIWWKGVVLEFVPKIEKEMNQSCCASG